MMTDRIEVCKYFCPRVRSTPRSAPDVSRPFPIHGQRPSMSSCTPFPLDRFLIPDPGQQGLFAGIRRQPTCQEQGNGQADAKDCSDQMVEVADVRIRMKDDAPEVEQKIEND